MNRFMRKIPHFVPGALVLAGAACNTPAWAEETEVPQSQVTTLDNVVVVGTSRSDVTELTSLAPVDVISVDAIQATGAISLNQALQRLLPSFNFPQGQNFAKGTNGVRSASLRGLSPAYTLILVNGKRRNPSSVLAGVDPWGAGQFVDINTIPISAIERVEVLRDGASAQYGSDAVAGVINIVLKQDDAGGQVQTRVGQYDKGDGFTRSINGWTGRKLGQDGFINFSLDAFSNQPTDRGGPDQVGSPNHSSLGDERTGRFGQAARRHYAFLVNSEYDVTDAVRGFTWANTSYTKTANGINPNYPTSKDNIIAIYPNGFQPVYETEYRDSSLVSGLRWGDRSSGQYELSASYGQNIADRYLHHSLSPSYGRASQTEFYLGQSRSSQSDLDLSYLRELAIGRHGPWTLSAGASFRYETWENSKAGDTQSWNNGGELIEDTQQGSGGTARWGSVDISGINPTDLVRISRSVYSAYAGLEGNLSERLQIGATVRAEHYSDFGATYNGKLSARYAFTDTLALRGTVSTGYVAPSLAQLGYQSTGYTGTWRFDGLTDVPGRTRLFRPDDPAVSALGAKALEPQESFNATLGLVYAPVDRFSLTVDAYHIKIRNNIASTTSLSGTYVEEVLAAAGLEDFTTASFYANAYDTRTTGIDIVSRYRLAFADRSRLELSLGASAFHTDVYNVLHDNVLPGTSIALFTRAQLLDPETGTPRNKLVFSADYQRERFGASLSAIRYGTYVFHNVTYPARDQKYSPQVVVDLDVSWRFSDRIRATLGAQNLFDSYPEQYILLNQTNGINRYAFINPDGSSGRFFYTNLAFDF
ncbi:MAG: TonB-dependent receptor [Pseudoxanthomonas sp.]